LSIDKLIFLKKIIVKRINNIMNFTVRLVMMAKKHWRTIAFGAVGVIGAALLNLVTPEVVRRLTSGLEFEKITPNILLIYAAVLVGAYLLRAGFRWLGLAVSHIAAWTFVG